MSDELLDSNDYTAIRKAIDASLTEAGLPKDVIEQDIYLQASLDWVSGRVDVDALPAERRPRAKRAAIYYCAHLLAPVANIPTSDSISGIGASYTRKVTSPEANASRLLTLAESEISAAVGTKPPVESQASGLPGTIAVQTKVVW